MSLFRVGGTACLRASRLAAPINARFVSNVKTSPADPPTTPRKDSELINKETPSEAMSRHQPDYDATIDHGTSYSSSIELHFQALFTNSFYQDNSLQSPSV
jgi:NADH dehydrogenase (ubiquinone) Fe-S protein 4